MTDAVTPRPVMRADNAFGIPACFYWTVDDVVNWVESIGYGKYKVRHLKKTNFLPSEN